MTEKRYDWIDEEEYNSYWIADLNKSDKTKEEFFDKEVGYYNIIAYEEYLENNDCLMNGGEVTERLNQLTEENQQLKEENQYLSITVQKSIVSDLKKENKELKENCKNYEWYKQYKTLLNENEQLKQQMQRLYNYFADWFDDRVPPSDFSEMWDFVKEDEKWD